MFNNPAPSLYEFFLLNWIFKKSIPKVEPRPGVELGQAVLQVLGAGLVTLLSMNRGPSHPPWQATLQSTGGPCHPADHALVALFAHGAEGGPTVSSCSSLPCLLA